MGHHDQPPPAAFQPHSPNGASIAIDFVDQHRSSSNPYVHVSPVPDRRPRESILKMLEKCCNKLHESTNKAGVVAENVWQHVKTGPSFTDVAIARITQGTKVLAEGGSDKVFQQTFGTFPGEKLWKSYACYFSTSAGPVIGTLYVSTARLAFCSDNPLRNTIGQQGAIYYKVVVPLDQLRAVSSSANRVNPAEKYIQIFTTDGHEFWFMGFVSYDKALKNLTKALQHYRGN